MSENKNSRVYTAAGLGLLGLAVLATLGVAIQFPFDYDDAYISFRITENLVKSGYPFFNIGVPVYTNTSLLYPVWNALLVFVFGSGWTQFVSPANGFLQVIIVLRLAYLFFRKANESGLWFFACLSVLPMSLSGTQLATGNSGLETSLYQLVLTFSLLPLGWKPLGWLAAFVRPEGFLMGSAQLISQVWEGKPWKQFLFWGILSAVGWLCLSYFWFGTIIPQSINAKASYQLSRLEQIKNGYNYLFLQGYGFYSLLIGSALFTFPWLREEFRPLLIWLVLYTLFFSLLASWWAWYVPPILIPIQYMAGRSVMEWLTSPNFEVKKDKVNRAILFVFFLVFTGWEFSSAYQRKAKDSTAFQVRLQSSQKIGNWLNSHLKSKEQVLLEPLGLIGYHAQSFNFLDYPGLSRPEMSEFLHSLPWKIPIQMTDTKTDSAVLTRFKPAWLVLFPYEIPVFNQISEFEKQYQKVDSISYYPQSERFRQAVIFKRSEDF